MVSSKKTKPRSKYQITSNPARLPLIISVLAIGPVTSPQVVTPVLLSALIDMEHTLVDDVGSHESVVCLATRRARKWTALTDGGFGTRTLKAFQDGCATDCLALNSDCPCPPSHPPALSFA